MTIVQHAEIFPHVVKAPDVTKVAKLAKLSADILAWAGVNKNASSLDRAGAIVGWVAAHAVHPDDVLHPNGHTLFTDVLPPGKTWAQFNTAFDAGPSILRDNAHWFGLFPNSVAMIESLVGTIDAQGNVADNGMLKRDGPLHWRIRDFATFRAVQCTLQCKIAQGLLGAQGIHSVDLTTTSHDPMAVHNNETGRWAYICASYGELLAVGGVAQNPLELLSRSLAGNIAGIAPLKLPGTGHIVGTYFNPAVHPAGMTFMTVHCSPNWAGGSPARAPHRFGALPSQSDVWDVPASAAQIMPELGCGFAGIAETDAGVEIRLVSSWPGHTGFQRRLGGGQWKPCGAIDYPPASGQVAYRSVDALGWSGKPAVVAL